MSSPPSYKSFSSFPFLQEKTLGDIRPQGFQMLAPPSSSASPPFDSLPQIFYFNTFSYLLSQDIPFHACQCHFFFTTVLPFDPVRCFSDWLDVYVWSFVFFFWEGWGTGCGLCMLLWEFPETSALGQRGTKNKFIKKNL